MIDEAALALTSEHMLFAGRGALVPASQPAKVLLARSTATPRPAAQQLVLIQVIDEREWRAYEVQRLLVEREFGIEATEASKMVAVLRDRAERLGLQLFLARDGRHLIGAVGRFRLPAHPCARLQEVDVFPSWRGHGFGNALMVATLDLLRAEGSSTVVVGADEDDWPLSWYRRCGFHDVARVPMTR